MSWLSSVDAELVERRFGANTVDLALTSSRIYVDAPGLEAGRLTATVVDTPGGKRLSTPIKISVRVHSDERLEIVCACGSKHLCDHAVWLLVDIALHRELREAILAGEIKLAAELTQKLPSLRARALEERTLDERLAAWLPPRTFDDDFEIDVEAVTTTTAGAAEAPRSALLLFHRKSQSRAILPARDVLASRLVPRHRRVVDLTAPYHQDRNALVALRGQATLVIHLLREEIGLHTEAFKARARFPLDQAPAKPHVERDDERLVIRWYAGTTLLGEADTTFVFAGPFPYLWVPASRSFHAISPDVDLDVAMGMQRVPSLPIHGALSDRVGRALLLRGRGRGIGLPKPEEFGLPPLEAPSFELRLTGSPLDVQGELSAVYSVGKLAVGRLAVHSQESLEGRDSEAETLALQLLEKTGLSIDPQTGLLRAYEDHAVHLWREGIASLRASKEPRFEVLAGESLARTKVGPAIEIDIRVTTTAGWLDTEFEFRAKTLAVEIGRLHRALADGKRWVVLGDGSLSKISDQVALLIGEAEGLGIEDKVRLPPHQFGRIARWIELADGATNLSVHLDTKVKDLRSRLATLASKPELRLPSQLTATLRPYQRVGVAWLQLLRELGAGGLLADDMGLGKTLMTLTFLAERCERAEAAGETSAPSIVVCPTSVVGNWAREAARFTPKLRVIVWTGSQRRASAIGDHDLMVTTYGVLRREIDKLQKIRFACAVLDEAQNIKNPAAATAHAARRLEADMRVALTGTPIENRLSELWSLMTFVNPGILGTAAEFDARYEHPISVRPDGAIAAELRAVVRPFVLRRTKREVLTELPPKTEIERACPLGLRQKRLYDALALTIREAMRKKLERRGGARTQLSVLTAILRLRQMACDPRLVDTTALATDSAKRAAFLEIVRELVAEDRRALVFSSFVELLTLWRQDLDDAKVRYEYLDGSTTNRDPVVDRFQTGNAPLFLISLKAGGAGLNLTAADTVIHLDPWWNPAAEDQATDRAHRIGQKRAVTVVRLIAQGTIEDKIGLLKKQKRKLAAAIIDDEGSGASGGLSEEDIALLLGDADASEADDEDDSGADADADTVGAAP